MPNFINQFRAKLIQYVINSLYTSEQGIYIEKPIFFILHNIYIKLKKNSRLRANENTERQKDLWLINITEHLWGRKALKVPTVAILPNACGCVVGRFLILNYMYRRCTQRKIVKSFSHEKFPYSYRSLEYTIKGTPSHLSGLPTDLNALWFVWGLIWPQYCSSGCLHLVQENPSVTLQEDHHST